MRFTNLVAIFAISLAACSGGSIGGGGSMVPAAPSSPNFTPAHAGVPGNASVPAMGGAVRPDATSAITVGGQVSALISGGFTMHTTSAGYVHVYTSGSTSFSGPKPPVVGEYVTVTGTGSTSTSISATSVAGQLTVSGTVTAFIKGGFTIDTTSSGYLHIFTNSSTVVSGKIAVGQKVTVTGVGSVSTSVTASSVSASGSYGPTHVITADYLGTPWGTSSIAWSSAAPYLNWAETGTADATAIHNAGIKTMYYVDPNRTQSGGPMYTSDESTFAHDCSGKRVVDTYAKSVTQYVMNPASPSMQSVFRSYVSSLLAQGHFDALFEDDAGALSAFAPYTPFSTMPCSYNDSSWIAQETSLNQAPSIPVIVNGLSGLDGDGVSQLVGVLGGSNALGATYEQCYSSNSQPKQDGWLWATIENTELAVEAKGKAFECMLSNTSAASSEVDARLYAYASYLLTYDPASSIYRTLFATPSGLHVMPEVKLVVENPTTSTPANVSSLEEPGGTYARQYASCYLAGSSVGACAVVVNPSLTPHAFPFSTYHHSLTISGNGVLDGGTVSTNGAAPPATLGAEEAAIVFQ